MTPSKLSVLRLVDYAPVAVGSCEPEMSELASLGYVEQFKERVGLEDRPTWRITSAGREAARAQGREDVSRPHDNSSISPPKLCMIMTHDGRLLPGDRLSADEATRGMFESLQSTFERAVAAGRQEERERCARIAQNQVLDADGYWAEGFSTAAAGIAAAIRAQGE